MFLELYLLDILQLAFEFVMILILLLLSTHRGSFLTRKIQEGATKEEIDRLPKYIFNRTCDVEKGIGDTQESTGGIMTKCDTDAPTKHFLRPEDSVSFRFEISFRKLYHLKNSKFSKPFFEYYWIRS